MKGNNSFFAIILLAIVLGSFYLYNTNQSNKNVKENPKMELGSLPDFFITEILSVEQDVLTANLGGVEQKFNLSSNLELIQQVKDGKNGFKNILATKQDLKTGVRAVIFYNTINGSYNAYKIQLLNF